MDVSSNWNVREIVGLGWSQEDCEGVTERRPGHCQERKKNVFLVIGSLGCNFTIFLDQYHKDPAVKKILDPHYLFVRIEWPEVSGGKELWESYANGKLRVPIWVILDPAGKILTISGPTYESGFPNSSEDILHYTKALEIGSPRVSRAEIEVLHQKLKHHGE